jgi:hypothetical protein
MGRSGSRSVLSLAVLIAIALGSVSSPAWAAWTKLYKCKNPHRAGRGTESYHGIRVQLYHDEIRDDEYREQQGAFDEAKCRDIGKCSANDRFCWNDAKWSGTGYTTIKYPGNEQRMDNYPPPDPYLSDREAPALAIQPRETVTIGWTVDDNCCEPTATSWLDRNGNRARGLQPTLLLDMSCTFYGGGVAFYDWPDSGDLTLAITNRFTGSPEDCRELGRDCRELGGLSFEGVEYAISPRPLSMDELEGVLSNGFPGGLGAQDLLDLPGPEELHDHDPDASEPYLANSHYVQWSSIKAGGRLHPGHYTAVVIEGMLADPTGDTGFERGRPAGHGSIRRCPGCRRGVPGPCARGRLSSSPALIIRGAHKDAQENEFAWLDQVVDTGDRCDKCGDGWPPEDRHGKLSASTDIAIAVPRP